MSRGFGRGGGARREMSGLQTELLRSSKLNKMGGGGARPLYPEYEPAAAREPTKEEENISRLMEDFREQMRASVYYLKQPPTAPDVERYSDRYHQGDSSTGKKRDLKDLKVDLTLFPEELHVVLVKKKVKKAKVVVDDNERLMKVLRDAKDEEEEDEEKKEEEEEEEVEEEEVEDEEEGNDYMDSYFDNGEEDDVGDIDDDEGGGDYY
ncbi:hypothetical protein GGI07_001254 [Coemansia sp. Benny D115]|nr:hypothetical protein GGI07_001254 [Coemansia sp. Benny D115]